jgi:hypothetical protein
MYAVSYLWLWKARHFTSLSGKCFPHRPYNTNHLLLLVTAETTGTKHPKMHSIGRTNHEENSPAVEVSQPSTENTQGNLS